jgi:hypothetical protein
VASLSAGERKARVSVVHRSINQPSLFTSVDKGAAWGLVVAPARGASHAAENATPAILACEAAVRAFQPGTEEGGVDWTYRRVRRHGLPHPIAMGRLKSWRFLTHLAV